MTNEHPRHVLPIPDRRNVEPVMYDASRSDAAYEPVRQIAPPEGAPNIFVVLLDDAGFASNSAFGGPCRTPTFDRLAENGLRYTRFHTTAICSPTRLSLLTGRNHHSVGMGTVADMATAAPGYTSVRPTTAATVAETLRLNGYSTAQFGKCHEVPVWETSPMGPFDRWPTGGNGFEYFYGFIGGETSQFYPSLTEGTRSVSPDRTPEEGYHLTEDIARKAERWLGQQRSLRPGHPFFMYFAPGATHAPIHVPEDWLDKYQGEFDEGWDVLRERIFARQKELGVIPEDAEMTERPEEIPAWDDMPDDIKPVLIRQMELYAAFLEHTDAQIGAIIEAFERLGVLDDTLIYIITGDNGASGEAGLHGTWNESLWMTGMVHVETPEFLAERIDEFGTPASYPQYSLGWAHALDTPYQWTKRIASHWGGTRNGLIVHWPNGIDAKGELRHQFHHVVDVAPTLLEVAGLPQPVSVHGAQQQPIEGVSMAYSFNEAKAEDRHVTQYFEVLGNRGIYHEGWTAVTMHQSPLGSLEERNFEDDVWELYDTNTDWTQARNLADEHPEKLEELKRLFLIEAARHNVLPLDDRSAERADPDQAGRPALVSGNKQTLYRGLGRLHAFAVLNLKNKSHFVTAQIDVPKGQTAEGVIVAQGGRVGGWSLYAKEGRLCYCYNFYGIELFRVEATEDLPEGRYEVRMEFEYDGGGPGRGGSVRLIADGEKIGEGRVERTQPLPFASDEPLEIGRDGGSPVTFDYTADEFAGEVHWVELEVVHDEKDSDHLVTPEERMKVALARE